MELQMRAERAMRANERSAGWESRIMIKDITWVEANLDDVRIVGLIARLPQGEKNLAFGGCCGCACGDAEAGQNIKSAGLADRLIAAS
jgi:hypothetical protein